MSTLSTLLLILTLHSQPGESLDHFARRVAVPALRYTNAHVVEVCGAIVEDGDGYRIDLGTTGEQFHCAIPEAGVATFHTHPADAAPGFSDADMKNPGYLAVRGQLFHQDGSNVRTVSSWIR